MEQGSGLDFGMESKMGLVAPHEILDLTAHDVPHTSFHKVLAGFLLCS
jgi:hypothetical protein